MSETVSKHDLQPLPTGTGRPVTEEVINYIQATRKFTYLRPVMNDEQARHLILSALAYYIKRRDGVFAEEHALGKAIEVVESQSAIGLKKYGTVLRVFNGRDARLDVIQELADALQYSTQSIMEQEEKDKCVST